MTLLAVPALEQQPHALRDGTSARRPAVHRAHIDPDPQSELALGQTDAPQGATQLSRSGWHGASISAFLRMALCRHYAYTYRAV